MPPPLAGNKVGDAMASDVSFERESHPSWKQRIHRGADPAKVLQRRVVLDSSYRFTYRTTWYSENEEEKETKKEKRLFQ